MHPPREGEHQDRRPLVFLLGADSHDRAHVPSSDELCFLRADTEEANNGLLDARAMAESARDRAVASTTAAERTRREQRGLVERPRHLETAAFGGPQQNDSARSRARFGPSSRQRRRQGVSDYESA